MSYSTVEVTCGTPGSGKSFTRGSVRLVDYWLLEEEGLFISNFPYTEENRENIAQYLALKKKVSIDEAREEVARRVVSIPEEVKRAWMDGDQKPLEYFKTVDTAGAHIAIDEIHNYCPSKAPQKVEQAWSEFVGEVRHLGATLEVLSQDEFQINQVIRKRAEVKRFIVKRETELIPYIKIPVGDFMQFAYKLRGRADQVSRVYEHKRVSSDKWAKQRDYNVPLLGKYFQFYDSFSAPEKSGGGKSGKSRRQPFEKYGWFGLCIWFLRIHFWRAAIVFSILAFFIWFLLFGGLPRMLTGFSSLVSECLVGGMMVGGGTEGEAVPELSPEELAAKDKADRERLQARVDELQTQTSLSRSTLEEYTQLKERFDRMQDLTGLYSGGAMLSDGLLVKKGEAIVYGKYKGRVLEWVDIENCLCGLSGDIVLRLPVYRPSEIAVDGGGVKEPGNAGGVQRSNKKPDKKGGVGGK